MLKDYKQRGYSYSYRYCLCIDNILLRRADFVHLDNFASLSLDSVFLLSFGFCLLPLQVYWFMQMMFLSPRLDDGSCNPLTFLSKHARMLEEPQLPLSGQQHTLDS